MKRSYSVYLLLYVLDICQDVSAGRAFADIRETRR